MHRILIFCLAAMAASAANILAPSTKQKATVVLAGGCLLTQMKTKSL